ncbi:MAG: hypothetical protein M1824_002815, partial [Vezdaea acicularis]
ETFAFLARHNIGESLALFYEEFAAWLEGAGRWVQAQEVYTLGIDREARPQERLLRKYTEFQVRFEQRQQDGDEPSSPALPTIRPALAAKVDPFASSSPSIDPQTGRPRPGLGGNAASRAGRQKLAIFSDAEAPDSATGPAAGASTSGWESIGSLDHRRKENVIEARPWVGETLSTGKRIGTVQKMAVFKDDSLAKSNLAAQESGLYPQNTVNARTGRLERVFVNLQALYPDPSDPSTEMSLEELRAKSRGWLSKDWSKKENPLLKSSPLDVPAEVPCGDIEEDSVDVLDASSFPETVATKEQENLDSIPKAKETNREERQGRSRKLKVMEIKGETQTVQTKLESPHGPKIKRKASAEPTMTFHTRAATDEIYDIFNQPLQTPGAFGEEEESGESDDEDDYTSAGESTGTGRISSTGEIGGDETSEVKSVSEWSEFSARKHVPNLEDDTGTTGAESIQPLDTSNIENSAQIAHGEQQLSEDLVTPVSPGPEQVRTKFIPIAPEDYEPPSRPFRDSSKSSQNRLPFMTPIAEKTESSLAPSTVYEDKDYFNHKTPSRETVKTPVLPDVGGDELWSSPFQEVVNEALPRHKIAQPALVREECPALAVQTKAPPKSRGTTVVRDTTLKGPIIKDLQCNPVDDYIRDLVFEGLQPPLSTYEGFFDHRDRSYGKGTEIRKFTKAVAKLGKTGSDKTTTNITMPPILQFEGVDRQYRIKRELGKGAFAPVYLVENAANDSTDDEEEAAQVVMGKGKFSVGRQSLEAIKMEDPPTFWEFYIMRQAARRLGVSRAAASIIRAHELHLFADECYLVIDYCPQGTLLDLVNYARADAVAAGTANASQGMDESVVMFFSIELFRVVEALHSKSLLHGDLKADNCLVRFEPIPDAEWSARYRRDGSGGWEYKGLSLIDFGRGIDLKNFNDKVQFVADWKTGPQDCAEMRELRPWTFHVDYFGLAGVIHSMLFGKYIETVADRASSLGSGATNSYRLREGFKRYWQTDLWTQAFELLLNPGVGAGGSEKVLLERMKAVREAMEEWLEGNCERGVGLKMALRRLEERVKARR